MFPIPRPHAKRSPGHAKMGHATKRLNVSMTPRGVRHQQASVLRVHADESTTYFTMLGACRLQSSERPFGLSNSPGPRCLSVFPEQAGTSSETRSGMNGGCEDRAVRLFETVTYRAHSLRVGGSE